MRERRVPPWQPWVAVALFAVLPHFIWEMAQAPLYRGMAAAPYWPMVRVCAAAAVGDGVIALLAYGVVAAATWDRLWLMDLTWSRVAGYALIGLVVTVILERVNVGVSGRWTYGPAMPTVAGIGVAPLAQWLVIPPFTLWLARRFAPTPDTLRSAGGDDAVSP
jgi:hypothetical protein